VLQKDAESAQSALAGQADQAATYDMADLVDDPELQKLHADRMAQLQQERERRAEMQQKGHGTYTEIEEGDFLEVVTKSHLVIVHFFHREFERCKIMDKHLGELARKYFKTRFTKMHAPVRVLHGRGRGVGIAAHIQRGNHMQGALLEQ
jgi:thiol-disulfide isomerase/thioredoxin